jgi:predicted DNA-binding antitoxin AbrB/MazE fold protein
MKFLASVLIIISLAFSATVFAENINAEFKPLQDVSHIKEGDLVEVMMRFWPIENADLAQFKKLEKTIFFSAFYLAEIESLQTSTNNSDVVELKAIFIVKSTKAQTLFTFKYNNSVIEIHFDGAKIEELKNKSQNYFILDQTLNGSYLLIMIIGFLLVLVFIAVWKRQELQTFIIGLKPDAFKKAKRKYDVQFKKASLREDFELIYQEKEIWLKLLESRAPAHNEFFKVLNQYQFKKEWNDLDIAEVRSAFDVVRGSFEK